MNLRLLWAHLCLLLLVFACALLYKSCSVLYAITICDVCGLSMVHSECKMRDLPATLPNAAIGYASVAICLERLYSTIRYRWYNTSNSAKPWLAMLLFTAIWSITIFLQFRSVGRVSKERIAPICQSLLTSSRSSATLSLAANLCLEMVSLVLSLSIDFYNKRLLQWSAINRAKQSLSSRFQIDQNVKVNKMVTPSTLLQTACYIPNFTLLILISEGVSDDYATNAIWLEIGYAWKLLFALAHPIFGIARVENIRKRVLSMIPASLLPQKLRPDKTPAGIAQTGGLANAHFDVLNQMWVVPMHYASRSGTGKNGRR